MEAFASEKEEVQATSPHKDFGDFIRAIEEHCQKALLSRKNELLYKEKVKQNWLSKTKIIPPSFAKLEEIDFNSNKNNVKASTFYTNKITCHSYHNLAKHQPTQDVYRKTCNTSHGNNREFVDWKATKSNWKLQLRKDELNIAKFKCLNKEESNFSTQNSFKPFKVRKLFNKIQDNYLNHKPVVYLREEKQNLLRLRLKTAEVQPNPRRKYFE